MKKFMMPKVKSYKDITWKIIIFIILLIILIVTGILYMEVRLRSEDVQNQNFTEYTKHYAFIVNDTENEFWKDLYAGAKEQAEKTNVYLESFGEGLAVEYSKIEKMQLAIAAKVDGIILEADASSEMLELIDEAVENEIPVVTVMSDSYGSKRQSFIGIGSYNLGREYGRQIVRIATKNTKNVFIITDGSMDENNRNIFYTGMNETLSNEGNHLSITTEEKVINHNSTFGSEEAIRDIFIDTDNLPDILICLNEQDTINACQAVVDYNMVGKVDIIGYYIEDTIRVAIERDILEATVTMDARQMGASGVDSLNEYIETGYANDYVVIDVEAVTANNIGEYIGDASKENEP